MTIETWATGTLLPDAILEFWDTALGFITVREILADRAKYDGVLFQHPIEGREYSASGMFFADSNQIFTHGHGRQTFRLMDAETWAETPEAQCNFDMVKAAICAAPAADAIKIWESFLGRFKPNKIELDELVKLIAPRINANIKPVKDTLIILQNEWNARREERLNAKTVAASPKVWLPFDLPDEEAGPVLQAWDEVLCAVKNDEPPMRSANNWPIHVLHADIPDMHILTSETANGGENSKLPAPKNYLLKNHNKFSLELELGDYITFFTMNPLTKKMREVAPSEHFIERYLNYERSKAPKVYTVMTMPIVLARIMQHRLADVV